MGSLFLMSVLLNSNPSARTIWVDNREARPNAVCLSVRRIVKLILLKFCKG